MFASQNYATTIETATSFDFGPFRCFSITPVQRSSNDLFFSTARRHYFLQDFSHLTFPWLWKLAVTCTRIQADNLRRYFQWNIKFMKRQFKESQGAACPLCHLEWTSGRRRRSSALLLDVTHHREMKNLLHSLIHVCREPWFGRFHDTIR